MLEISWYGRGGQGAFTAARLLADAWVLGGADTYALAFPTFGPERRGAPVRAFSKLDRRPIADRGEIARSDFAVFLDDSLFDAAQPPTLKDGGRIIINSKRRSSDFAGVNVLALDAEGIAERSLGLPIVNTVMIGAIVALSDGIGLAEVDLAIDKGMAERLRAGNKASVRAAAEAVRAAEGAAAPKGGARI